ncbi:TIR domain-containing protein [Novipirellula rosea]|uniref:TIR domain-containing protein n=1 Tax=Novipirellula rosea TaxID=1031540 RepID=A0ABP8NIC8_9BACT
MPLVTKADLRSPTIDAEIRQQTSWTKSAGQVLTENAAASSQTGFDIFLSHSYRDARAIDAEELLRLKKLLQHHGLSVYVDWIVDRQLDRNKVNAATAAKIRKRMDQCKCLLFATSTSSSESKWMPWELGYKDGKNGRAAILPVVEQRTDNYYGQEYLGLYPFVVRQQDTNGQMRLWLKRNDGSYIELSEWIRTGRQPSRRAS